MSKSIEELQKELSAAKQEIAGLLDQLYAARQQLLDAQVEAGYRSENRRLDAENERLRSGGW